MAATDDEMMIPLIPNEGTKFIVPEWLVRKSKTLNHMMDDLGLDNMENGIPLTNVSEDILKLVIEWLMRHKDDPPIDDTHLAQSEYVEKHLSPEDEAMFQKLDQTQLFELILAVNYLDIGALLAMCCAQVANLIAGKSTAEIRETFNIKNDFTPEEEEAVRQENAWCLEKTT